MKKILSSLLFIIIFTLAFVPASAESLADVYLDPYGRTLCAAHRGYWKNAPENSASAIKAAVENGADMVEIDVKLTSDGVPVLMADETVERTCYGYDEKVAVGEMTFDELSKLNLLMRQGGVLAEKTQEKIPTLEEILKLDLNCLFLIDCDGESCEPIYSVVSRCNAVNKCVFLIRNKKSVDIEAWRNSKPETVTVMEYFKGNVIFSAVSAAKKSAENNDGVMLTTKVPYGVVFGKTVLSKTEGKVRTAALIAESELCGTIREDSEVWWDDLISRGFSVLVTDYVPELRAYIDSTEERRQVLADDYNRLVNNWKLPNLKSDKYLDYKLAYNNAARLSESILKDASSSRSQINTAIYQLQKAYDDIVNNYAELEKGTAGMTVTPVRVILCIAAAAAVICAEIFCYKKKKKD